MRFLRVVAALLLMAGPLAAQKLKIDTPLPELEATALRDSTDPVALYNLGLGYMGKKRWGDADRTLRHALAIDPQFALAQLALAVTRELDEDRFKAIKGDSARGADIEETRRYYQRAFLLDPFVDLKVTALLWRVTGNSMFTDGFKAFVEGRYDESYRLIGGVISAVTRKEPRDSAGEGLLWAHALSATQIREYSAAEEDLQGLIRITEGKVKSDSVVGAPLESNQYRYMLAALKQQAGNPAEAVALYQQVLEHDVSNFMAHVQLARIYEAQKDWPRAVAERRRAVETNADDASLLTDLGVALGRSGDFESAAATLREAAAANPRDARPLFWLGVAELQLKRSAEAKEAFTRYLAIAPSRQAQQVATAKARLAALP